MSLDKSQYIDFGAPSAFGAHVFKVEIPEGKSDEVIIIEDYGYQGSESGIPKEEERVILKRDVWSAISDVAKREFNDRLKTAKMNIGRWHSGENRLDRLLGKELCVLAWAAENANVEQLPVVCSKWAALRPEERWWLFAMTVAEAGLPEDSVRGWRKALFHALSDGERMLLPKRKRRPIEADLVTLPLFSLEHRNE